MNHTESRTEIGNTIKKVPEMGPYIVNQGSPYILRDGDNKTHPPKIGPIASPNI